MTPSLTSRTALGLAAISLAVLGCTAISAETGTATRAATQGAHAQTAIAPVTCVILIEASGNSLTVAPTVQAIEPVTGSYALRVQGPGTNMNQGGAFSARAGETIQLGRMMMSGRASSLDAELTLTIDGQTYSCPSSL